MLIQMLIFFYAFFLFFFLCCCCRLLLKLLQKGNGKLFPAAADKRQGCLNNNTVGVLPSGWIRSIHTINWHAQIDHSSCSLLLKSNLSLFFFSVFFFFCFSFFFFSFSFFPLLIFVMFSLNKPGVPPGGITSL